MIKDKKVLAITLARGGSKGIPNKNLAVINGRSLLQRAIECGKSSYIDKHVVSSDSEEILKEAERFGAIPLLRPTDLASDFASSAVAIAHVLETYTADYIVEIMCTSPFKKLEHVEAIIQKLHQTGTDSVVGVKRLYDHHPARVKYIVDDQLMNFFPETKESRRQDLLPEAYVRNGSIYAFTLDAFQRYRSRYGGITRPYVMSDIESLNIDEPLDLTVARLLGEQHGL
jgi:CMP-N-acetylneuraminic acid synthetase